MTWLQIKEHIRRARLRIGPEHQPSFGVLVRFVNGLNPRDDLKISSDLLIDEVERIFRSRNV